MGLCYIPKSTRAVKRLPANLYDPPPGVVLPRCLCQLAETDKACITSSLFQQQLHLRFAEFPPFSRADYTHVVLSLRKAPVLWNEVERRAYDMLDVTSADGSGRETSVWSGLSLGGDRSIYCRTADKCTWTPPKDSDQLLCHQRLYHTDRDWYPRIIFLGISMPFFKHFKTWFWLIYCLIHKGWQLYAMYSYKQGPTFSTVVSAGLI